MRECVKFGPCLAKNARHILIYSHNPNKEEDNTPVYTVYSKRNAHLIPNFFAAPLGEGSIQLGVSVIPS